MITEVAGPVMLVGLLGRVRVAELGGWRGWERSGWRSWEVGGGGNVQAGGAGRSVGRGRLGSGWWVGERDAVGRGEPGHDVEAVQALLDAGVAVQQLAHLIQGAL